MDRSEEALKSAARAVGINPRYAMGWANQAIALTGLARWADALIAVGEALEFDPELTQAYYVKAVALAGLGKREDARRCLEERLQLSPNEPLLLQGLEQVSGHKG